MKLHTRYTWGLGAILLGVVAFILLSSTEEVAQVETYEKPEPVSLQHSSVPLYVTGIVEAADQVVVAAQTAGTLRSLAVREGSPVSMGTTLAVIDDPVSSARLTEAYAAGRLSDLQQEQAVVNASYGQQQQMIGAYSAQQLAQVRAYSGDNRVQEAARGLLISLEAHAAQLVASMDFVDNNRSLFTNDARRTYDTLTTELYGQLPEQFGGDRGVILRGQYGKDLFAILNTLRSEETVDVVALQELTSVIGLQSELLAQVFSEAEEDVFKDRGDTVDSATYAAYNTARGGFLETYGVLVKSASSLQTAIDGVAATQVSDNQNVAVSQLDEARAREQHEIAQRVAQAAASYSAASQGVVSAQLSLAQVVAPFTGSVSEVYADVGSYVTPGTPLFTLVGDGARELVLTVPTALGERIESGTVFRSADRVMGVVSRIGAPSMRGTRSVVITMSVTDVSVGESLAGYLELNNTDAGDVFSVPRGYLFFSATGPYIVYEDEVTTPVSIVYDAGDVVFVRPEIVSETALVSNVSINL